jgi:DNA uptake protein ComE-like DNA-binding protein
VTIVNDREIPATTVTVLSDAQTVIHAGLLAPKAQSTLTLSQFKGCLVTVAAVFEEGSVSDGSSIDVCRVKLIRLTDGPVVKAAGQASPDMQDAKRMASEPLASPDPARVDINTASIEELNRLGGRFGRAIIAGRPYASIDDLVSKRVLTRATFSQIQDQITAN